VIVGGGLSGLTAAAHLGRHSIQTTVLDAGRELGGRARTERRDGCPLNYGPHRLYRAGAAVRGLEQLGIRIPPASRGPNGGVAARRGQRFTLPVGLCSLLTTGLLGAAAKREMARLMTSLTTVRLLELERVSLAEWLRTHCLRDDVLELVLALVRYTTYCDSPDRLSASAALEQLRLSARGDVLYVHHGRGSLVDVLMRKASAAGTVFVRPRHATAVQMVKGRAVGVTLADGTFVPADAVIVATDPETANRLLQGAVALDGGPAAARVAVLDVALHALPSTRTVFAVGIDEPWCFSADSVIPRVAPGVGTVVHLAKYLPDGPSDGLADERQLEGVLDLLQPGWRPWVVHRRFVPSVVVSYALVTADNGGFAGRPGGRMRNIRNAFVAGDWVGPVGQLADAAVSSGISAARHAAEYISERSRG